VIAVLAAAVCTSACEYRATTTITVRDPSAVRVDVETRSGTTTALPASPDPSLVRVPESQPPVTLQRVAGGPIVLRCDDCGIEKQTLVPMRGAIELGDPLRFSDLDWTRKELSVAFVDASLAPTQVAPMQMSLATPWSNVASVARVRAPSRATGAKMLLAGLVVAGLGVFGVIDGASEHESVSTAFGLAAMVIAAPLLGGAGWYLFAPSRTTWLYGGPQSP
jgi:hypothetical protein